MNRAQSSRTSTKPDDPPPTPRLVSSATYVFAVLNVVSLFTLVGLAAVGISHLPSTSRHPSDVTWAVDVTHSRPASEFVRMHNTIATRTPFLLGDASGLPAGIGDEAGAVSLNRYVGAAHATCTALNVDEMKDRYDFRICTSPEILALTAVIPMSSKNHVLTYASSDGDDYETGEVKHEVVVRPGDESYGYDFSTSPPPPVPVLPPGSPLVPPPSPPPPPNPLPPTESMQSFMGSDNEVNLGEVEADLHLVAYCCSGVYTHMTGEGPSRRR